MQVKQVSKRIKRNVQTMQSMLLAHKHEGQGPHLTAITTLYLSLLEANAEPTVWRIFYNVAQLPLRAQAHVNKCRLQTDLQTESCSQEGGCHHAIVDTTVVVRLEPLDEHRLEHGQTLNGQIVTNWWAKQLKVALNK